MIRIVLLNLMLLILPTILYVGYIHLTSPGPSKSLSRILEEAPIVWLLLTGGVLAIVTLFIFATPPSGRPGEAYHPPVFRDGKIIPGNLVDKSEGADDAQEDR